MEGNPYPSPSGSKNNIIILQLFYFSGWQREFPKNTFQPKRGTQDTKLLKNVTLFGGNSSGKTNFPRAFSMMRYWVMKSYSDTTDGKRIPIRPFLLNTATENGPSHFEV
jgi:hypothetical protein